jgi:hypothetical protein
MLWWTFRHDINSPPKALPRIGMKIVFVLFDHASTSIAGKKGHRLYTWGTIALDRNPKLAAMVMECIATWSETEVLLGAFLAALLKLESAYAVVRMYLRLNSADARRSVIDAAAHAMLNDDDYKLFSVTTKALKAARNRRNDFAHGVWGMTTELPDALLWASADDRLAYDVIAHGAVPAKSKGAPRRSHFFQAREEFLETIQVYRFADLQGDVRNAREALMAAFCLRDALHPDSLVREARRRELLELPLLRKSIESPESRETPLEESPPRSE